MLYFYPLSRCQPCNQIFLSPAKDKLPNSLSTSTSRVHAPPRLEDEFEARFSRGRAKYRRWRRGGGRGRVKPPRRALLLYTKYNRSPQLSSETSEIRFDPSTLLLLPPNRGRSSTARVARARNDTRWPLRFKAPDICGIKKLFPMNGRRSVVSARINK